MRRIPAEQRRGELIAAAARVITRDGVAAATTRAVVAEAQMPLGSFHYIFDSRDDLITSVLEIYAENQLLLLFSSVAQLPGASPESVILAGLDAYIGSLEDNPLHELGLIELAAVGFRSQSAGEPNPQYDIYRRAAADCLRHVSAVTGCGWSQPVEAVARHLVALADGLTTTWLADRDSAAAHEFAAVAASALARFTTPPASAAAPTDDKESPC